MSKREVLISFFDYFSERRISGLEKFLIIGGTIIYIISPWDLLPGIIFDDLGILGVTLAYMNWRVKKLQNKREQEVAEDKHWKAPENF